MSDDDTVVVDGGDGAMVEEDTDFRFLVPLDDKGKPDGSDDDDDDDDDADDDETVMVAVLVLILVLVLLGDDGVGEG